jgi:exosome complex component RRP41
MSPCCSLIFPSRRRTIELAAAVKNTFEPVLLLHLYPRSSIDIHL